MPDKNLGDKVAYFMDQDLLDLSDDESGFPDESLLSAERALADTVEMPPPTLPTPPALVRQRSSFLRQTPKDRAADFETHASKQRSKLRTKGQKLTRPVTAPERNAAKSLTHATVKIGVPSNSQKLGSGKELKHTTCPPDFAILSHEDDKRPFYVRVGVVPRELKTGKHVKPAKIQLEIESKQLLKGKILYFYPNDDISMARRHRIHKVIQLGAAWVNQWTDDITHIIVDDASYKYTSLLKHLNRASLPRKIALVKYDPYVPESISLGLLVEPTARRFLMTGAPKPIVEIDCESSASPLPASQVSLQVKPSLRELAARNSQTTDPARHDSLTPPIIPIAKPPNSSEVIVKDSFAEKVVLPNEECNPPNNLYNDELSEAIEHTKAISHLPLDEEDSEVQDDAADTAGEVSESGTDSEPERPSSRQSKKPQTFASHSASYRSKSTCFDQSTFQCMAPSVSFSSQTPNARTIQVLEEMCQYYDQMQDQWRTFAYRKGIATLRKQTTKISTKEEALALPFVGSRLAEKIEEIVTTDRLRRLDSTREDPTDQVLRLFLGIYGVGLSQATRWIQAGHRTLEDLVKGARLTDNQKVGIEHYEDFATRIPRAEVETHGAFVRRYLQMIDPGFSVTVMGSYRRGAKDSGDVDCIISKPKASLSTMQLIVFDQLIPQLFAVGFLKVGLATSSSKNGTKWHGASCLPSSQVWRRLDLLLVPEEEMGAALIYFTGNDIFNRSMRLLANKKGMRLNQRGLYKDIVRARTGKRVNEGTLVEGKSERRIFEILEVPWRGPTERIC